MIKQNLIKSKAVVDSQQYQIAFNFLEYCRKTSEFDIKHEKNKIVNQIFNVKNV
jgi:hypothetical protein